MLRWVNEGSLRVAGPALFVGIAYYAGCLVGFGLRFPSSGISFFWPPTAILTASLLLAAPRSWPALLMSALVAHAIAHIQDGVPMGAWPIQFAGNATQAILGAWIIRTFSRPASIFANARSVSIFILGACIVAPAVASLVPAFVYVSLGWALDFVQAWRTRTISNMIAMLTIVPPIVTSWRYLATKPVTLPRRTVEFLVLLIGIIATHYWIGTTERSDVLGLTAALYAPTPFLLWATIRFGGPGLSFALVWTTLLTISVALTGHGPLGAGAPADAVVGVQLLLTANAIPMMLLAGVLEEQRSEHVALVDVERQKSAILKGLPDLVFLQNRAGEPVLRDRGDEDLLQVVLPEEMSAAFERELRAATADQPSVIEYTHVVGGTPSRFEARFIGVDDDRVLTIIRDITSRWRSEQELREAQQRYALATAAGGIGVWDFNVHTGHVHTEGTLKAMLGYSGSEIGDSVSDWERIIHPDDRDDVLTRFWSLVDGRARSYEAEFRLMHKNGSVRWILSKGAVTDTIDGMPSRIRGTYTDITERKGISRSLQEASDALVRVGRIAAMSEVSASIAHELRQPLSSITTNALTGVRWIDSGATVEQFRELLTDMLADSRRAGQIVERTQSLFTNRPSQKAPLNLNDLVRNMVQIVTPRLREFDVRVSVTVDESLPPVLGDPVQMQQVLLNLIVNAVDAMREVSDERRQLCIATRRSRSHAVISVRDNGNGFVPDNAKRVFDPFYTTKSNGTGMGLTISRSIVNSHGGSLWAVSNIDRGATFRFKIPVVDDGRHNAGSPRPRRVLVVDDHRGLRKSLSRMLLGWGHRVAAARDGSRALTVAERFQPDVAIVDISMDGMSGVDLARRLRSAPSNKQLHLIALTAYHDDGMREACLAAGFDSYLVKPDQIIELQRLLS